MCSFSRRARCFEGGVFALSGKESGDDKELGGEEGVEAVTAASRSLSIGCPEAEAREEVNLVTRVASTLCNGLTTPPAKKRVYVHTSKNPTEAAARHPRQMKISFRALILAPQRTVGYGWEARVMEVKTKKGTRVVQVCSSGLPEAHVGVKGYEYPKLQKPSRTRNMGIVIQFLGAALESTNVCGDMSGSDGQNDRSQIGTDKN
jgi:hypothetical protein